MRALLALAAIAAALPAAADPLRRFETPGPREEAWVRREDARARRALARLPGLAALEAEILASVTARRPFAPQVVAGRRFYLRGDGQAAQLSLLVAEGGAERVLIDGARLAADGGCSLAPYLWPSPDGTRVAYGVRRVGTRGLTLSVRDLRDGEVSLTVEGLRRGPPLVAWGARGDALYLVPEGAPRVIAQRGGRAEVAFEGGDEITGLARRDGRGELVVIVRRGDRERAVQLAGGAATPLVEEGPGSLRYAGEHDGAAVFATTRGAPRGRVVRAGAAGLEELVAEGDAVIETWPGAGRMVTVASGAVFVVLRDRGLSRLRRHPLDGGRPADLELPAAGVIWSGLLPGEGTLAFSITGFVDPGTVYELDPRSSAITAWARPALPYDPSEIVTEPLTYRSGMGDAPMLLVRHRAAPRDGRRPTIVYGYAFGGWISGPWFRPHLNAWLRRGGLFLVPALRGGGELGEAWRAAGSGVNRQHAIDDLQAAAAALVEAGWTRPRAIIAEGQSLGASVAAAWVLQAPRSFAALILAHPVLDLLRYHHDPAGRTWIEELGDPDDPAVRRALRRVSPVHLVRRGRCYPPTLILPSERDPTAAPWHAFKLHAALRRAQACENPILLRVAWGADHTYGRDAGAVAASYAAQLAFAWSAAGAPGTILSDD